VHALTAAVSTEMPWSYRKQKSAKDQLLFSAELKHYNFQKQYQA
jgi:hypothetical protein